MPIAFRRLLADFGPFSFFIENSARRAAAVLLLILHNPAWAEVSDKLPSLSTHWLVTLLLCGMVIAGLKFNRMFWHLSILAWLWQGLSLWEIHAGPLAETLAAEMGRAFYLNYWASAVLTGATVVAGFSLLRNRSKSL